MTAISTRTQSRAGLVAMGATVLNLSSVALGAQSYDYKGYFDALVNNNPQAVTYPCLVAVFDLDPQKGFETLGEMGYTPQTHFNIVHLLLHYQVAGTADFTIKEPDVVTMNDHYEQALKAYAAGGGWSAVNHGPVELIQYFLAVKHTMEGITYHASIFKYQITLNL